MSQVTVAFGGLDAHDAYIKYVGTLSLPLSCRGALPESGERVLAFQATEKSVTASMRGVAGKYAGRLRIVALMRGEDKLEIQHDLTVIKVAHWTIQVTKVAAPDTVTKSSGILESRVSEATHKRPSWTFNPAGGRDPQTFLPVKHDPIKSRWPQGRGTQIPKSARKQP